MQITFDFQDLLYQMQTIAELNHFWFIEAEPLVYKEKFLSFLKNSVAGQW